MRERVAHHRQHRVRRRRPRRLFLRRLGLLHLGLERVFQFGAGAAGNERRETQQDEHFPHLTSLAEISVLPLAGWSDRMRCRGQLPIRDPESRSWRQLRALLTMNITNATTITAMMMPT